MNPGDPCTLNGRGDLAMDWDARDFIRQPCVFVKHTKAGMVQVALRDDPRRTYTAPPKNLDALAETVAETMRKRS